MIFPVVITTSGSNLSNLKREYGILTVLPYQHTSNTMKLNKIIATVSIVTASLNSFAFDRVESHLRDCSNFSNLVLDLTSKINSKFSIQDAMYVHKNSIQQLPEPKQELLNDMFYTAIERLSSPRAEVKHLLVKQCSH